MGIGQATIERVTVDQAMESFGQLLDRVGRSTARVIVEEDGTPVAAIVSREDLERLARLDDERAERFAILDDVQAAFAGVPEEEIERETARALAKVRAEMREERERATAATE
jgi:prevent-host-death family protein